MSSNNSYRSLPIDALPKAPTDTNPTPQELFKDYYANDFLKPDEFGVIRDPSGNARAMDGRILNVSQDDIADILQMANGPENLFRNQMGIFPQPSIDADPPASIDVPMPSSIACRRCAAIDFKKMNERMYGPELYTKDETNEMFKCLNDCQGRSAAKFNKDMDAMYVVLQDNITSLTSRIKELETKLAAAEAKSPEEASTSIDAVAVTSIDMDHSKAQKVTTKTVDPWEEAYLDYKIAEVYYPLNNNVTWLSTKIDLVQKDLDVIHEWKNQENKSTSIDAYQSTSIDAGGRQAEKFYTRDDIDQIIDRVYDALRTTEDRLDKRCDDIFFPFDSSISTLQEGADWIQKEIRSVQKQLACKPGTSKSIDVPHITSIDSPLPTAIDVASVEAIDSTPVPESPEFRPDLATHAYDKIEWHTINIESLNQRLQNISDTVVRMDERWARSDEATRSFMSTWFRKDIDKVDASFPTRSCLFTD